jgi:shikimate kinase
MGHTSAEPFRARHLVLVGLMGAGKTTVGARCAARLERPFVDTDELVETATARTIAEIFESEGERAFRAHEHRAVADAFASPDPLVIACGGGAVVDAENRDLLRARGVVVWLRAGPAVLAGRVGPDGSRPLLSRGGTVDVLTDLADVRDAAYRNAAHTVVDTDDLDVEAVVDAVLQEFVRCSA